MDKKYGIIGLIVLALVAAVYFSGGPKNMIEQINKLASPDSEKLNNEDAPNPDDAVLDRIVQEIKNGGLHSNRTIIKSSAGGGSGSGGSGGGGSGAKGCSEVQSGDSVTLTGVSGADYFIRAKVTGTENTVDAASGETITYTYAEVDEYEKIVGSVIALDESSGKPIIDENVTEDQYLGARATVPDLNPDQLLIVSYANSGSSSDAGAFTNMLVEYESPGGFSVVC